MHSSALLDGIKPDVEIIIEHPDYKKTASIMVHRLLVFDRFPGLKNMLMGEYFKIENCMPYAIWLFLRWCYWGNYNVDDSTVFLEDSPFRSHVGVGLRRQPKFISKCMR